MSRAQPVSGVVGLFGAFLIIPVLAQTGLMIFLGIVFSRSCGDWLKMAADANSIAIASERLDKAITYLEDRKLTSGNTGVFYTLPTWDIGLWYINLKAAQKNLKEFPSHPTEADTNTALSKLRETLLDHASGHDVVTMPAGIFVYPYNTGWLVLWWATGILACIGASMFGLWMNDK